MMDELIATAKLELKRRNDTRADLTADDKESSSAINAPDLSNEELSQRCTPEDTSNIECFQQLDHRIYSPEQSPKHADDGESKGRNTRILTINAKELHEAHIAVLQEKLSESQTRLKASESLASDYRSRGEVYMDVILKLNKTTDALGIDNKKLTDDLKEAGVREHALEKKLSECHKKLISLTVELNDARIAAVKEKISVDQKKLKALNDDVVDKLSKCNDNLVAENKRLKEESDTLKASAAAPHKEEDNEYLII
jgi:predicted DNA binding CopG/RHH family protein